MNTKTNMTRGLAVVLCTALLRLLFGFVALALQANMLRADSLPGRMRDLSWRSNINQASVTNSYGEFGVKAVLLAKNELLVFYAIQDNVPQPPEQIVRGAPFIQAASCPASGGACTTINISQNQRLGSLTILVKNNLKEYIVGVARFPWQNSNGQTLKVTASRRNYFTDDLVTWPTTPLKQVRASTFTNSSLEFLNFYDGNQLQPTAATGIQTEVGVIGGESTAALFKLSSAASGAVGTLHIAVDRNYAVSVITPAEYVIQTASLPEQIGPGGPNLTTPPTPAPPPGQ
jgi:hypothetical protein